MERIIQPDAWLVTKRNGQYEYSPFYGKIENFVPEFGEELMEICGTEEAAIRSMHACYKLYNS
jgi:hypothetical protein